MNSAIVKRNFILFFILLPVLFSSCTKIVTTDIGGGLLPGVDGINAKDSFLTVITKNIGDSVNHVTNTQDFSLGYISNDPLFGKTSATVNVQLVPTTFPTEFNTFNRDSTFFDSIVLVLSYKGPYGDSFQNLAFRVYQISNDEPFLADSVYSSAHFFQKVNELTDGPVSVNPINLKDSVYPRGEAATNQIRLRLNQSFGELILHGFDTAHAYKSDSLFKQYFRGFSVVPEQTGNCLLRVNLQDTNTKLAVYYRFQNGGTIDTTVSYFKINSSAGANNIRRDRSGAQVANYYPSSNTQDSILFLEASPGIFTNVTFPPLNTLSNIVIQRAELTMEQIPDLTYGSDIFFTPPQLFLTPYSTDSMRRFATPNVAVIAADSASITNTSSMGCVPLKKTDVLTGYSTYSYSFDLTRYVQGIVTKGQKSYNFVLFAPGNDFIAASETNPFRIPIAASPLNPPAAGRVRLGGGNNTAYRMKLHIVYSPLPH